MNLENQVVNLELSKRLKELNIKQESLFYWHNIDTPIPSIIYGRSIQRSGDFLVSAFTVAELGNIIYFPKLYMGAFPQIFMHLLKDEPNEANVRAKMLIYLIENGLL